MSVAKLFVLIGSLFTAAIPPAAARLVATGVLIALVALPTWPQQDGDVVVGLVVQTFEGPTGTLAEVDSPVTRPKVLLVAPDVINGHRLGVRQFVIASTTPIPAAAGVMEAKTLALLPVDRLFELPAVINQVPLSPQQIAWGSVTLALLLVLFADGLLRFAAIGLFAGVSGAVAAIALHYNGLADRLAIPETLHSTVLVAACLAGAGVAYRALQNDPARLGLRLAGKTLAVPLVPLVAQAGLVGTVSGLAWGLIPLTILTPALPALTAAALLLQAGLGLGPLATWLAFAAMLVWRWSVTGSPRQLLTTPAMDTSGKGGTEAVGGSDLDRVLGRYGR